MTCQEIETILKTLKVDSLGRLRGMNKAIDKIHSAHLRDVDNQLTDVRIYVAKQSVANQPAILLKDIDNFIYQKQIK